MTLGAIGLGPDDPCYDPNHPWYLPNFFSDSVECQCMAMNPGQYPIGQQCATVAGTAQVMGQQASSVTNAVGNTIGNLLGGAASGVGNSLDIGGYVMVGAVVLGAIWFLTKK